MGDCMRVNNPLYSKQGIHVISSLFTIDKGITKVLLIKRSNEPYKDMWALVGGALYNNETLEEGMTREIFEKTGIENVELDMFEIFSRVDRSPVQRMIAVGYIGVIDVEKVQILRQTMNTSDCDWVPIDLVKELAYDHNEILDEAIQALKQRITKTGILRSLYPNGFTLPELQKTYEAILNKKLDRRNFRKKMLNLGIIYDTGKAKRFEGNKPAKVYKFKAAKKDKNVF